MDYPGKVITKTQVTPTQTSASGNWTLDDQAAAIKNNNWPVAGVPNPISKSLRFNSADSAYLNRTPASASNRRTWTLNLWVKRSKLSYAHATILRVNTGVETAVRFDNTDIIRFYSDTAMDIRTSQVFRDVSAWGMLTVAFDTTQATASNRVKLYWNGVQITAFGTATYPSQNYEAGINQAQVHALGAAPNPAEYFDGYMTEINFIDGQALDASYFGLTNPQTGQWIPKKYTGTYGTNGFYVNFKDATSTSTLGYDYSGNANNWTANNFSVTAGAGNDSLTDVPTPWVAYNTTGDVGGVIRGNYATLNPLVIGANLTLSNGGLTLVKASTSTAPTCAGTFGMTSGKWYFELTVAAVSGGVTGINVGVTKSDNSLIPTDRYLDNTSGWGYFSYNGTKQTNAVATSYGSSWTTNDVIGVAVDAGAGKIWFSKNGTFQASGDPAAGTNEAFSGLSGNLLPAVSSGGASNTFTVDMNFGQRPFAYTPPTGFRSLCTTNLPATAIGFGLTNQGDDYFNTVLYTGNGSSQSITGVGFQPDFTWIKSRSGADNHNLFNSVVGLPNRLFSNLTNAENTTAGTLTSFNSDGFSVGSISDVNANGVTFEGWNWKASGSTVSNTAGTITSTVSANTTAGFSIVTYTGTGANATVGHGLGATPGMIIVKDRSSANDWVVWHRSYSSTTQGYMYLNSNGAVATSSGFWNSTAPTSTLVSLGNLWTNTSGSGMVMYAFAAVPGFSAFGSWVGNGSTDGPFIYTGFRPRYLLQKGADVVRGWNIWDTARSPYNAVDSLFQANSSGAESTGGYNAFDLLSNGFKVRSADANWNNSGSTYIYMAFAESPFQFANAR